MRHGASLRAIAALSCLAASASGGIVISPKSTILIGTNEPIALQKAAADLAADSGRIFGVPLPIVHRISDSGPAAIRISLRENSVSGLKRAAGVEILQIQALPDAVLLTGSDLRGAIYAVYEFSQRFFGVDPLYYWTDRLPARRTSIALPDALFIQDGPPTFRYRGWFINDEDLLTGWKPGTADHTGIALDTWDKIFEAVLRLKGNMIVPGTFIFPDEPQVKAAGERGLIISQHHIEVLGTNTYRWPDDQPYSFSAHPELLTAAWTAAMKGYQPNQEVIWTVGYRGRHDRAFWVDDAAAGTTDAERAATIQRAIAKQMEIVRGARPSPFFLMNAWMESVPFLQQGLLRIPTGVAQVWPDNGHGVIRDDGKIRAGEGVYYHTAMYNSMANQLTEMVPLERIERELGRAAKAHATEYLLINTSDIRPVLMTTRGVMELAWSAATWSASKYLHEWCRQFGPQAAPVFEEYYRAYFAAPGRYGPEETQTLADNAYHTVARKILLRIIQGVGNNAGFAAPYLSAAREAQPRWEEARRLAENAGKLVVPASRDLYIAHVKTQLDIHRHSNSMLFEIASLAGEKSPDQQLKRLNSAVADTEAVLRALDAAEFGKWRGFYGNDLMVSVRHTLALEQVCRAKMQGKPLPADVPLTLLPVDPYLRIKAYQGTRRVPLQ